jgi:hypothetical protein
MLRLPGVEDVTAPLLEPLKRTAPEDAGGEAHGHRKRRRRRKSGENLTWEHHVAGAHSRSGDRRQMRGFLIGGVLLLGLLFAGLAVFMKDQGQPRTVPQKPVAGAEMSRNPEVAAPRGDQAVLAEAEPLAEKFLAATSVDELLPLVRHPEITGPRMAEYYPDGKVDAPGLAQFNPTAQVSLLGNLRSIMVVTKDYDTKRLAVTETPGAMKVDWEAWVGWSEMPWDGFRKMKPVDAQVFRVTLSPVEYYNFAFSDDRRWQSYRLESPDREHSIYGYAEKGSPLDQRLRPNADEKSLPLMLSLKFPEGATADDQVEITRFVNDGWVEQDPEP